jgi:hypothetical protein
MHSSPRSCPVFVAVNAAAVTWQLGTLGNTDTGSRPRWCQRSAWRTTRRSWSTAGAQLEHSCSTAGAQLQHSCSKAAAQLQQSCSTAAAQLQHSWSTAGAQLQHSWSTAGAQLGHSWGTAGARRVGCAATQVRRTARRLAQRGRDRAERLVAALPTRHIGVFGRTGSGKSDLIATLLHIAKSRARRRLAPPRARRGEERSR